MVRLFEFLRSCEKETGTRLVTFDFEIIFFLYLQGPSPSMTVLQATNASLAAFCKSTETLDRRRAFGGRTGHDGPPDPQL